MELTFEKIEGMMIHLENINPILYWNKWLYVLN